MRCRSGIIRALDQAMLSRLALISATFHAFNIATLLVVGRLWRHRYAEEPAIRPRPMQLATDLGVAGLIAVLSALIFGTAVGVTGAEPGGLLAQWFFSELQVPLAPRRRGRALHPDRRRREPRLLRRPAR